MNHLKLTDDQTAVLLEALRRDLSLASAKSVSEEHPTKRAAWARRRLELQDLIRKAEESLA